MDWPLTAAVGTLVAVAGVAGFGAMALMKSEAPQKPRPAMTLAALQAGPPAATLAPLVPGTAPLQSPAALQPQLEVTSPPARPFELQPPSVVALAPANLSNEPVRPQNLALPRLQHEPPPKAAKPAVVHAPVSKPAAPLEPHVKGVMTASEIARIKASLRLTGEQEPLWRPVEAVLRDIGKQQLAQIRSGAKPEVDTSSMTRVYYAAQSLLGTLRPDQKEQVRRLARSMGYASVASML